MDFSMVPEPAQRAFHGFHQSGEAPAGESVKGQNPSPAAAPRKSSQPTLGPRQFVIFSVLLFLPTSRHRVASAPAANAQLFLLLGLICSSPDCKMAICSVNSVLWLITSLIFTEVWEGHVCSSLHLQAETVRLLYF